jgi:hypothetical protein
LKGKTENLDLGQPERASGLAKIFVKLEMTKANRMKLEKARKNG